MNKIRAENTSTLFECNCAIYPICDSQNENKLTPNAEINKKQNKKDLLYEIDTWGASLNKH
jgi:hypothetical protein